MKKKCPWCWMLIHLVLFLGEGGFSFCLCLPLDSERCRKETSFLMMVMMTMTRTMAKTTQQRKPLQRQPQWRRPQQRLFFLIFFLLLAIWCNYSHDSRGWVVSHVRNFFPQHCHYCRLTPLSAREEVWASAAVLRAGSYILGGRYSPSTSEFLPTGSR